MNQSKRQLSACLLIFTVLSTLIGCVPPPPHRPNNICQIFNERPHWYWVTKHTEKKWGLPISLQMALIYQESSFNGKARPSRGYLLGFIPWSRPSSAQGYSQALDSTWQEYQKNVGKPADRRLFADTSDFLGWYADRAHQIAKIDKKDAFALYLAYHEGPTGYLESSYREKTWLINAAKRVESRSDLYEKQLKRCEKHFQRKWWHAVA